jgi:hypothetical protein
LIIKKALPVEHDPNLPRGIQDKAVWQGECV